MTFIYGELEEGGKKFFSMYKRGTFFRAKKGGANFFWRKKGGYDFFYWSKIPKTWLRYLANFGRSLMS